VAGFVQIIEFRTSKHDEVEKLGQEWEAASSGDRLARRRIMLADRDDPDRRFNIVFFDSYEDAMKNSDLPVTNEFASKMMALADGPPTFYNLDLVEDRSL
jgi:hypothetical protein